MSPSLEHIFKDHYARLCHFAWQLLKDEEMAKDVVQEVFLSFLDNRTEIPEATKSFLFSSVRNACFNKLRRQKLEISYLNAQNPEPEDDILAINTMIKSEVMAEILTAIETLPAGCQKIFRMGYLEGLKNPKIAEELNISINTVKTQKKRGLQLVKLKLNPEYFLLLSAIFVD